MKKAEQKRKSLLATLGDINRPLRVRPVRLMGRDWWAVDAEDTWPGMVMDLRRLGYEATAWEDEVLVREGTLSPEPQMEGPAATNDLKPFPTIQPSIQIRTDSHTTDYDYSGLKYLDEYNEEDDADPVEDEYEPENLDVAE